MARLLGRVAEAFCDFWLEIEGHAMMYLMGCGIIANLVVAGYGIYWLFNHVRIV